MFSSTTTTLRSLVMFTVTGLLVGASACGAATEEEEATVTRQLDLKIFEAAEEPSELSSCALLRKTISLTPNQIAEARESARQQAATEAMFHCGRIGSGTFTATEDSFYHPVETICLDGDGKKQQARINLELYSATATLAYSCVEPDPLDRVKVSSRPQPMPFAEIEVELPPMTCDTLDCCVGAGKGLGYCLDRQMEWRPNSWISSEFVGGAR